MSIHISFECNNKTCQANLVEGKRDGPTVNINGIDFTVIKGHVMDEKFEKVLHQIINRKFESVTDLKSYIGKIEGCSHVAVIDKSHRTGVEILFGKSIEPKEESLQQKQKSLQAFQKQVAEQYWNTYIEGQNGSNKDHSMLKSAVIRPSENKDRMSRDFDKAIENNDKELFCSCFRNLEFYQLYPIVQGEELKNITLPGTNSDPVDLSKSEGLTSDIKNYLKERGFSGIVALSDGKNEIIVASDEFNEISTPMAIHSVGKIATGMLALRLIEEGIFEETVLEEPIRLDPVVMKALPIPVQERLKQTTFKDVMLHQSGLKDYLKNYQDDIQKKLDLKEKSPIINSCEDLLAYAEQDLIELKEGETHLSEDEQHYSNLGLLLVGLSLQHLVSEKETKPVSFEEALSHYVIKPPALRCSRL